MAPSDEGSDRRNSVGGGVELLTPRCEEEHNVSLDDEPRFMQYNERSLGQNTELLYVRWMGLSI